MTSAARLCLNSCAFTSTCRVQFCVVGYNLVETDNSETPVEKHSERASERGSERTQLHGANTNSSKNRSNKTETQLLGANTTNSENRNNKTETTKQKQQNTTQNFHSMSSVAISVHCCLHRCSHLVSMPPSCIGVRTLYSSIAARCWVLFFYRYHSSSRCLPWSGAHSAIMANIVSGTWATSTSVGRCIMSRKPPGIGTGTKWQKMPNISFPQR